jgi:hypothetical protein
MLLVDLLIAFLSFPLVSLFVIFLFFTVMTIVGHTVVTAILATGRAKVAPIGITVAVVFAIRDVLELSGAVVTLLQIVGVLLCEAVLAVITVEPLLFAVT